MDTFFARNRLSAYLDGDLPSGEAREVEAAIQRDAALRAEYEELRGAVEFLRSNGPLEAPAGFANRLHIRVMAEPAPSRLRTALRRVRYDYVGLAAVAALALLVVGTHHPPEGTDAPPPTPTVAAATAPSLAPPASPGAPENPHADGILGDEGGFAVAAHPAQKPPSSAPSQHADAPVANDREPYQADWEKDASLAPGNTTGTPGSTDNTASYAANSQTQSAQTPTLYSPAPWRYRIHPSGANPLKDLIGVASALGGRIVDAKGRPLADYPMDDGDSAAVRIFVPSYNVSALQEKLKGLGTVDTIATDPNVLYQNGAEVPVSIEVQK